MPNHFHDIDFPAGCPGSIGAVGGEHPDGRPNAFAYWEFGPNVYTTVAPITSVLCTYASGRVVTSDACLGMSVLASLDDKISFLHSDVFGSIGIDLHLVVAPSKGVYLNPPF